MKRILETDEAAEMLHTRIVELVSREHYYMNSDLLDASVRFESNESIAYLFAWINRAFDDDDDDDDKSGSEERSHRDIWAVAVIYKTPENPFGSDEASTTLNAYLKDAALPRADVTPSQRSATLEAFRKFFAALPADARLQIAPTNISEFPQDSKYVTAPKPQRKSSRRH